MNTLLTTSGKLLFGHKNKITNTVSQFSPDWLHVHPVPSSALGLALTSSVYS